MNGRASPRVSVVIVTWNSAAHIAACLQSLPEASNGGVELVIVDNNSTDATLGTIREAAPHARVITNARNVGFGAAANTGLATVRGDYVVVMNPDAQLDPGALDALLAHLVASPDLGCVAPLQRDTTGTVRSPGRNFPTIGAAVADGTLLERWLRPTAVLRRYYRDAAAWTDRPEWLDGACLCFRAAALRAVGGFDAAYFMYAEELDLLRDLQAAGWGCAIVPQASVYHHGGASAAIDPVAREQNFFRSRYRLVVKTWGRPLAVVLRLFVAITGLMRIAEEAFKLPRRPGRSARFKELRRIARVTLWQWLGWRR